MGKNLEYEGRFKIGEEVIFSIAGSMVKGFYIRAITFTNSKVRYALFNKEMEMTIHNIDSICVEAVTNPQFYDFGSDNYS